MLYKTEIFKSNYNKGNYNEGVPVMQKDDFVIFEAKYL